MVKFLCQTSNLKPGKYRLSYTAKARCNGKSYNGSYALSFLKRKSSVIMFTDKEVYTKGENVTISIFAVDFEARPFNLKRAKLTITNSRNGRVIGKLSKMVFSFGKFEFNFMLESSISFGSYDINLRTSLNEASFHFFFNKRKFSSQLLRL